MTSTYYPWIPPDVPWDMSIATCRAGVHWDAIRAPMFLSEPAVEQLGDQAGAIIADTRSRNHYWLVPVGTVRGWNILHTRACGETQYVTVPSLRHRAAPGLYWLRPPTADRCLTDPTRLRDALSAEVDAQFGPRTEVAR